jgi:hypothetical protein
MWDHSFYKADSAVLPKVLQFGKWCCEDANLVSSDGKPPPLGFTANVFQNPGLLLARIPSIANWRRNFKWDLYAPDTKRTLRTSLALLDPITIQVKYNINSIPDRAPEPFTLLSARSDITSPTLETRRTSNRTKSNEPDPTLAANLNLFLSELVQPACPLGTPPFQQKATPISTGDGRRTLFPADPDNNRNKRQKTGHLITPNDTAPTHFDPFATTNNAPYSPEDDTWKLPFARKDQTRLPPRNSKDDPAIAIATLQSKFAASALTKADDDKKDSTTDFQFRITTVSGTTRRAAFLGSFRVPTDIPIHPTCNPN